ncbi:MAG: hypothetical protein KatS3mg023_1126 [Armatimonadota bacterium]|nr:MAG: hypothetical protein KatS3mg023_1126 [Armatimonadota bacterium]
MRSLTRACVVGAAMALALLPAAQAQTWVPVGTAEGGVAVYFNDTTNENPNNVSYLRVQWANSTTNVNGASISMVEPFKSSIFGDLGQYGFDAIAVAPTNTKPISTLPKLYAYDWNGTTPVQGPPVLWAMNVYSDWYNGPKNPSAIVLNSTLRGNSATILNFTLTPLGGGSFQAYVDVVLDSDGFIHWYNPLIPDTPFLPNAYPFNGKFRVTGTLIYDKNQDTTPGMDFYAGTVNLYAQAIPDASTVTLFMAGLLPAATLLRRRKV